MRSAKAEVPLRLKSPSRPWPDRLVQRGCRASPGRARRSSCRRARGRRRGSSPPGGRRRARTLRRVPSSSGEREAAAAAVRALLADAAALGDARDRQVHERADVADHAAVGRRDQDHAMLDADRRRGRCVTRDRRRAPPRRSAPSSAARSRDRRLDRRGVDRVEVVRSAVRRRAPATRVVAPSLGDVARGAAPRPRADRATPRRCTRSLCRAPASTRTPTPCRTLRVAFLTTPSSSDAVCATRYSKNRSAWSARVATAVPRTRSSAPRCRASKRSRKNRSGLTTDVHRPTVVSDGPARARPMATCPARARRGESRAAAATTPLRACRTPCAPDANRRDGQRRAGRRHNRPSS